jgi:hypothetical protein
MDADSLALVMVTCVAAPGLAYGLWAWRRGRHIAAAHGPQLGSPASPAVHVPHRATFDSFAFVPPGGEAEMRTLVNVAFRGERLEVCKGDPVPLDGFVFTSIKVGSAEQLAGPEALPIPVAVLLVPGRIALPTAQPGDVVTFRVRNTTDVARRFCVDWVGAVHVTNITVRLP